MEFEQCYSDQQNDTTEVETCKDYGNNNEFNYNQNIAFESTSDNENIGFSFPQENTFYNNFYDEETLEKENENERNFQNGNDA